MPSEEFTSGWQGTYAAANGFHSKDGIFKVTTSGAGGTFLTEDFRISSGNNKIIEVIDLTPLVFQMIDILIAVIVPGYTS